MEVIKIVFFALGLFFSTESQNIACDKVTVRIQTKEKKIVIIQENLFSIVQKEADSVLVAKELNQIYQEKTLWNEEFKEYASKEISFYTSDQGYLCARIKLMYTNAKDLKVFAIDYNDIGHYSLINIPDWNLKTKDGSLDGNYWIFKESEVFEFSLEPYKKLPVQYEIHKKYLQSFLENK